MNYTAAASEIYLAIKDPVRRAEIGDRAERIARGWGHEKVTKGDMESAILVADERFIPDARQGE